MRLAKQHKAYAAVLAVALGALVVDSLFMGGDSLGPNQAAASPPDTLAPTPAPRADIPALPAPAPPSLSARLDAIDGHSRPGTATLDLFRTNAEWLTPPVKPADEAAAPPPPDPSDEAAKAAASHRLTTVMASGARSFVIIDGQTLRLGQTIGDLVLIRAEPGVAIFRFKGEEVHIKVDPR